MIQKQKHQFGRLKPYSVEPRVWVGRCWDAWRAALLPLHNSLSQLQGGKSQEEETSDIVSVTASQTSETLLLGQQLLVSLQGILKCQSFNCRSTLEQVIHKQVDGFPLNKPVTQTGFPSPQKCGYTRCSQGTTRPWDFKRGQQTLYLGTTGHMLTPTASCSKISSVWLMSQIPVSSFLRLMQSTVWLEFLQKLCLS